jgi:CTP synthase (UTP-ammonia lyase)
VNRPLRIGIIGDFEPSYPSHIATNEALNHAARALSLTLDPSWLPTLSLLDMPPSDDDSETILKQFDGLWCAPGSPYKSMEGALKAIRFAREHDRPFVGT